jgi:hemoglobin
MKTILITLCMAASLVALPAQADDSLYKAFGERAGIALLMDDFWGDLQADKRMKPFFEKTNADAFKKSLGDQICQVSGGPCQYKGPDMKLAHQEMDIKRSDFHALVEVLQISMNRRGIAFSAQNRLLALFAPMHREIITVQ